MEGYEQPSDDDLETKKPKGKGKKASGKKDPNKPKRGKSAYLFFCADHRDEAKSQLGEEAKATEVTAELGRMWNEIKESAKKEDKQKLSKYEDMAKSDKERYLSEMEGYEQSSEEEMVDEGSKKKSEQPIEEELIIEEDDTEMENLKKLLAEKNKSKKTSEKKTSEKKTTGFSIFCKETRKEVKEENPDAKSADITKLLSGMWKELSKEDQQEWKDRAAQM
jgi:upstream-binding transcription factor